MRTLNIIGAGRVGTTLGRLFEAHGVFEIRDVLNRSPESAARAVEFIGAGRPVSDPSRLRRADVYLFGTPDDHIRTAARRLARVHTFPRRAVAFHCSGALPSKVLAACARRGVAVAGAHPVKSFSDPATAAASFAGTWCGLEGDPPAVRVLRRAFSAVGGRVFGINAAHKTLYHAALVLMCNDLTALLEAGFQCLEAAGVERETAAALTASLVRETVEHVYRFGTVKSLTGPVARGDRDVIARHLAALHARSADLAAVYRSLGRVAVDLSRLQGRAPAANLDAIAGVLADSGAGRPAERRPPRTRRPRR